jgi:hypothetical protein
MTPEYIRQHIAACRHSINVAEEEIRRAKQIIKDIQNECTHPGVDPLDDEYQCSDCGMNTIQYFST